jgi:N-acetyl-gamma-glutamyl-phosphate reductase/acetylglutamate kinase
MVGQPLSTLYPETTSDMIFSDVGAKDLPDYNDINLWVLAMPNGAAKQFVDVIPENVKIVDLSADYRFDDTWQYGLPEKGNNRELIRSANRVANPGCYATGQQASLLPLVDTRSSLPPILAGTPHIFGVSGYSGAGTTPSRKNDITCLRDNMMGYSLQGHIHEREVSRQLSTLGFANGVRFMPHVAQWFRGIHLTVAVDITGNEGREELLYRYRTFYEKEPLVKVTDEYPEVRDIANKHHVEIGAFSVNKEKTRLVLNTTIDNLLKGAATQCMQNMNLMLGLNETESIIPKQDQTEIVGSSSAPKE